MITAKFTHPENGYTPDKALADTVLELGREYEVSEVGMGQSHTYVCLVDPPRVFNSVLFDFYEDGKPINIYNDARFNLYMRTD